MRQGRQCSTSERQGNCQQGAGHSKEKEQSLPDLRGRNFKFLWNKRLQDHLTTRVGHLCNNPIILLQRVYTGR
ncbi:hypothetical protein SUGI_1126960 [Cryptomeria japonica]|nr:hypothetical protein SUGI_1126960 [Cryptomeria japonica]